ncbi:DUF397 domain-containing protein [Streptomyces sp. NPDC047049]|uniref:DUF397 domain-containing protein n=1 Tax=Streptomyces sp. NPDC047049 TaxID=3156688 RepID=UPI0033C61EAE
METLTWVKSSYSGEQGQCVEVADARAARGVMAIRDSKDPQGPILAFSPAAFTEFITDASAGAYDIG